MWIVEVSLAIWINEMLDFRNKNNLISFKDWQYSGNYDTLTPKKDYTREL